MGSLPRFAIIEGKMAHVKQTIVLLCFLAANAFAADEVAFDCFRESVLSDNGVMPFDGCDIDLTTVDPWKGSFVAPGPGLWRFTFQGVCLLFYQCPNDGPIFVDSCCP